MTLLLQEDQRVAAKAVIGAAQDFTHAATRHLYFQRAQLQLLLRQLTFCAAELTGEQPFLKPLQSEELLCYIKTSLVPRNTGNLQWEVLSCLHFGHQAIFARIAKPMPQGSTDCSL